VVLTAVVKARHDSRTATPEVAVTVATGKAIGSRRREKARESQKLRLKKVRRLWRARKKKLQTLVMGREP
jgi:hypothetical protein